MSCPNLVLDNFFFALKGQIKVDFTIKSFYYQVQFKRNIAFSCILYKFTYC